MLKVNSYVNGLVNENSEEPVESTVIVESDHTDISVDTIVIKEENNDIYVGTVIHDSCGCSELHLNTVIINSNKVVDCSQVVVTNNYNQAIQWVLVSLTGNTLYTTQSCKVGSIYTIDLATAKIKPDTKFKLKALVPGKEDTSCVVLEYHPKCRQSADFMLKGTGYKVTICYTGTSII